MVKRNDLVVDFHRDDGGEFSDGVNWLIVNGNDNTVA